MIQQLDDIILQYLGTAGASVPSDDPEVTKALIEGEKEDRRLEEARMSTALTIAPPPAQQAALIERMNEDGQ